MPFGMDLHFHVSERKIRDTTFKKALTGYSPLSPQYTRSDFEICNGVDCKLVEIKDLVM